MLFILATPIGNPMDITQRCQQILDRVDFVVCEEFKNGRTSFLFVNLVLDINLP